MSSWRQQQSEVVGGGKPRSGSVFRALVPIPCDWCGDTIGIGDTFTRSARGTISNAHWTRLLRNVCARCGPQGPPQTAKETPCANAT